jgi:hypothetical protein
MEYQFDPATKILRVTGSGPVTLEEVMAYFAAMEADPALPRNLDLLLDFSSVTTLPLNEELWAVVGEIKRIRNTRTFGNCAILATNEALFGMMRMFETFAEGFFRSVRTFRKESEAASWLASQRSQSAASAP